MAGDKFERLNKLLILTDTLDDDEDSDILAGGAISVDDMDDFIKDVEKLAMEKYGGATFPQLLEEDENDAVTDRAITRSRKKKAEQIVEAAEYITQQPIDK